jgi:hypothetical protein
MELRRAVKKIRDRLAGVPKALEKLRLIAKIIEELVKRSPPRRPRRLRRRRSGGRSRGK